MVDQVECFVFEDGAGVPSEVVEQLSNPQTFVGFGLNKSIITAKSLITLETVCRIEIF